ncbi:MAG: hypothetical protein P857_623 [Candidatus Xenolissoclinum pacificiensis L6]|uniref:Transposase n=1 Tax=Candidatus Xenolissoclinum pacificiensis L6 TaxID=1401685 RepID=W2V0F3_9RICK|nr:MAG: hypothetical protein P857_623 [Candidatus Xenolissoclinum pacificiensis L6]
MYFKKHKENILVVCADAGYKGDNFPKFSSKSDKFTKSTMTISSRATHKVLARWVVERMFSCLGSAISRATKLP